MPIGAVIGGAAVVGAGASVVSANKASKTAKANAAANNALQAETRDINTATLQPYVAVGNTATNSVQALLGLTPGGSADQDAAFANFRDSSGYKFRLNEGAKATTAALGNRGFLDSGAALKALDTYGQNVASQEFGNYYGALTDQQKVGLAGASATAGVGTNFANAVTNNNNAAANTVANAALSNGNAVNSALASGVSAYALNAGLKSSYGSGVALGRTPGFDPTYNYSQGG